MREDRLGAAAPTAKTENKRKSGGKVDRSYDNAVDNASVPHRGAASVALMIICSVYSRHLYPEHLEHLFEPVGARNRGRRVEGAYRKLGRRLLGDDP